MRIRWHRVDQQDFHWHRGIMFTRRHGHTLTDTGRCYRRQVALGHEKVLSGSSSSLLLLVEQKICWNQGDFAFGLGVGRIHGTGRGCDCGQCPG